MGKKRRGIDDENGDVQGQKVDEPNDVMKEDVSKSNHKKKKRDKVEKRTPHEYANTTDVQEMMESPRKKKKRSHDKLKEEDANGESLEDFTEDVKTCKKKKHKHRDKVETTESTLPKSNHSLEDEDRPKKKKKKKLKCDIETIEEPTLSEDVPVNDTEFEESVVIPKKKKKRKHDKEETTFLEDVGEVQCEETAVIPEKKRKKRKHDKTEKVPSGDDPGEVDFEDTEVVPKKKKKKKKKREKDECPSDERNETVTVDKSSEDEDAIDPPKEKSKAETEAKDDIDEETRQKLKQDWQDKTSLKKLRMQQPKMFLIDNFTNDEDLKMTFKPVGVQDLQDLVQYTVMGNAANTNKVRFCKVIRPALIPKVAVIVLNGVTDEHYQKHRECFSHLSQNHDLMGQILHQVPSPQQQSVLNQLLHVAISKKQLKKRAYLAKVHGAVPAQTGTGATPKATPLPARATPSATPRRTHYLLDDEQKAIWRYPRPDDPDYTHTKHSETVGDNSPLISVDCEMCVTKKGSELTRVSLVDEKHNMLYDSLVKPHNPIIDYVTRYSGITKQLLDPVTVRLEDVQRAILALLPSDAILVGQSLENDLRALKLYHPHVIDTSNLFTGSYRVALRKLAWKYLGVKIQEQETGHDSVEDAIVALKLLQLKLEKGSTIEKYTSNGTRRPGIELIPTESLFRCAQPLRRVCMLIDSLAVAKQFMKDPVGAIPCQNDSEALKKTVQSVPYSDFVCVQFYNFFKLTQGISQEADVVKETLKQLDQRIKQIYKTLPFNSFFLVVMAADPNHSNTKGENVKDSMPKGRFFTGLKLKY